MINRDCFSPWSRLQEWSSWLFLTSGGGWGASKKENSSGPHWVFPTPSSMCGMKGLLGASFYGKTEEE